ncbi:MAG: D-glucuronyl C5-epimerase family protein [Solirubrobacterales bacterium]
MRSSAVIVPESTAAADGLLRLGRTGGRGLRFEYLFAWYGAGPGWISAMPQATMASALARVSERSGDRGYVEQGLAAGEPLHWAPPAGTSVSGPGGIDPLLYPNRTRYLVANAEIWALIGMDELARVSGDARTAALADRIASRLLRIMPGWADPNRPGWTLYAQGSQARGEGAASAGYHELTVQGLRRLCRSREGSWCTWAGRFGKDVPASISSLPGREPALGGAQ